MTTRIATVVMLVVGARAADAETAPAPEPLRCGVTSGLGAGLGVLRRSGGDLEVTHDHQVYVPLDVWVGGWVSSRVAIGAQFGGAFASNEPESTSALMTIWHLGPYLELALGQRAVVGASVGMSAYTFVSSRGAEVDVDSSSYAAQLRAGYAVHQSTTASVQIALTLNRYSANRLWSVSGLGLMATWQTF